MLPPPPAAVAITLPTACSQSAASGRGRTTEPDRMLFREKGEPNRIPETLRNSRPERRLETGGNRWGRAGASGRCHGGLSVVTCPEGPPCHFRSRALSALAASDGGETPRQQRRWRRLRSRGFSLVRAAAVRSAAEPDPTGRGSRTSGWRQ